MRPTLMIAAALACMSEVRADSPQSLGKAAAELLGITFVCERVYHADLGVRTFDAVKSYVEAELIGSGIGRDDAVVMLDDTTRRAEQDAADLRAPTPTADHHAACEKLTSNAYNAFRVAAARARKALRSR